MWQAITQQLSDTLMFEFNLAEKSKISGGEINQCYMISDGEQRYFVKVNEKNFLPNFEIEAENIRLMRESDTVYVPELVHIGQSKDNSFLILNYVPVKALEDDENSYLFGQQLARLHLWGDQKEYGFDYDNFIGATVQPNKWERKWHRFFAEQRIGWQLQLLQEKGVNLVDIEDFTNLAMDMLGSHQPRPSLLHGDLWHGNVANSAFGPICYDPACYWGDRECDIAMTELFGGFQKAFYNGYESVYPLDKGYQDRKDLYNLYHMLNHCNLFGGHYLEQSQQLINRITRDG
ncbi:fructosamine kinase family protein [Vibrio sp.]|uniref:fructosamine kinase family protein n=1 Tax=Vibrio sp. TaxID=678 RepID=UPI003D134720